MSEKTLNNIRIVHKHDIEENWLKATNFIPKQGELIIYDVDNEHNYERFKIGDGINLVNDLPFGSPDSAVLYTEQELTDEQRAQAISNLDLGSRNWKYNNDLGLAIADISFLYGDEYAIDMDKIFTTPGAANPNKLGIEIFYTIIGYFQGIAEITAKNLTKNLINEIKNLGNNNVLNIKGFYFVIYNVKLNEYYHITGSYQDTDFRFYVSGARKIGIFYDPSQDVFSDLTLGMGQTTTSNLSVENTAADAKAVGDALLEKTDILDAAYLHSKTDGIYKNVNEIISNVVLNDYLIEVNESINESFPSFSHTSVICAFPQINSLNYDTFCFQIKGKYQDELYTFSLNGIPSMFKSKDLMISGKFAATLNGMVKPLSNWDVETGAYVDSEDTFLVVFDMFHNSIQEGFTLEELVESIKNAEFSFYATNKNFLPLNNTNEYTPTADYNPATKKYVDDSIESQTPQSDWNQNDETAKDYIKNKPDIATDEDILVLLNDLNIAQPVVSANNEIYTANDGSVYIL